MNWENDMLEMVFDDMHSINVWIWNMRKVVDLEFQGKILKCMFSVCKGMRTHYGGILKLQ